MRSTLVLLASLLLAAPAAGEITQPTQPAKGPGSSDYPSKGFRVTQGGSGNDGWYVFEPTKPRPKSAPLAIVMHGYYEFDGYDQIKPLVEHTVRSGRVVIYPRWQTGIADPCPGPFNIAPCLDSTVNGIKGALAFLRAGGSKRVQPQLQRTSYFAHSFGGIVTADLLNHWKERGVPKPRAVFLDDPHDGGLSGSREPALEPSLAGIPSSTLFQCHSGAHGVFDDNYAGTGDPQDLGQPKADGSCNALFPELTSIPAKNKDLVLTHEDDHGTPALTSDHGVCAANPPGPDAYDYYFCWKVWDALQECAYHRRWCKYALGDTPAHRNMGKWSDGTPIAALKIQDEAPIRP